MDTVCEVVVRVVVIVLGDFLEELTERRQGDVECRKGCGVLHDSRSDLD